MTRSTHHVHWSRGGTATQRTWSGRVRALVDQLSKPFDGCLCWRIGGILIRLLPAWTPPKQR